MMRLAVLSDVHGNLPALEAVLTDLETQGAPDQIWVLGDLVAFCPWPKETLARLRVLPGVSFLRGNTDRYLVTDQRPQIAVRSEEDWERMPQELTIRDATFCWTVERLSYTNYQFLSNLPPRLEMEVTGYGRVAAVHATPEGDEINLLPDTPEEEVDRYLSGLESRLLLFGHTHRPVDRTVGATRLINPGSVGLPLDGIPRPAYGILDFEGAHCDFTLRRVDYDVDAVLNALEGFDHPGQEWIGEMLRNAAPA